MNPETWLSPHGARRRNRSAPKLLTAIVRSIGCGFAALLLPALQAAEIRGTVLNLNTQRYLERATVTVEGTQLFALTAPDGTFRIAGVPAGEHTIIANYTGLEPESKVVRVDSSDTARLDFELTSEVYKLETFVVTSPMEGMAYSVNQQRRAPSARSVSSIDAFIDQTTGNPGEFLKNIEGIQMDYSQNEPQTIRIRGFDPNLTMVTMDGNEVASAASSGSNRAVQVDQLSIASIESVEVYKSGVPDRSANAIGGIVNFKTKSAFEQKGRRAFAQIGVNMDSHDFTFSKSPGPGHGEKAESRVYPIGRIEYSNSFFDNRLGIVFSVARDHTNQLGSSTTQNLNVTAPSGGALPAAPEPFTFTNATVRRGPFSISPNRQLRSRDDASLNLDFKVSNEIEVFLRTTFSDYHSTNRNHGFTRTPGTLAAGATETSYTTTNGSASQGMSIFDKYTQSWQINPGLKYRSGPWAIELIGGFSKSINHYRNPRTFTGLSTTLTGLNWTATTPLDTEVPTSITQNNVTPTNDYFVLNNYRSNQGNLASTNGSHRANHNGLVNNNDRDSSDVRYSGRFDVQYNFQTKNPFFLKAGLAYNEQIRNKRQEQKRWYWMGQDGIATADDITAAGLQMGRFAEPVPVSVQMPNFKLREPEYFSAYELWKYWQANPQVLQENQAYAAQQRVVGKQYVNEKIPAGYFMGNLTIDKLNILAGVRVEHTKLKATGYRVLPRPSSLVDNSLEAIQATFRPMTTNGDYKSDPFPYLHLRYEFRPGLQARASYTQGIGRPNLSDVLPNNVSENTTTQLITTNRAGLLPQRSENLDFSIEYYTKSMGQWSAGWFSRDVSDYITTVTVDITPELLAELNLGPEYADWDVRSKFNLGFAKWTGYELSFRQSLREWEFVPKALEGVTLWGNYTRISEMSGDYGTPGANITQLANVVPRLFNFGVSYRSTTGKLFVQLSTNYQARKPTQNLPAINANAQRAPHQEPYQFWNLEISYRLTDKIRLTCVGRNIFSERGQFSDVGIIRNTQQYTGIAWTIAARYDL